MREFAQKLDMDAALAEGGSGESDFSRLRSFPNQEIKERVTEFWMKEAVLSGVEREAILNPKPFRFFGIEDASLYETAGKYFLEARTHSETIFKVLDPLLLANVEKRKKVFGKTLLDFENRLEQFEDNRDLAALVTFLADEARNAHLNRRKYRAVEKLVDLILLETNAARRAFFENSIAFDGVSKLFQEIESLKSEIRERLFQSDEERTLLNEFRRLELLRKLARLELTEKEWKEISQCVMRKAECGMLESIQNSELRTLFTSHFRFYELAEKRDLAMFQNLMKFLNRGARNAARGAVLVTGGFHSPGITAELRRHNIPFVLVTPQISEEDNAQNYFARISGKSAGLDDFGRKFLAVPTVSTYATRLAGPGELETILESFQAAQRIVRSLKFDEESENLRTSNFKLRTDFLRSEARLELDDVVDSFMLYPKKLLHSPELEEFLDPFDRAHYRFKDGNWQSKDFPNLVLGTWEDVEKRFPSRSKMERHVVTRFKKPGGGTVSFYYFDNHAYSVPYGMEAVRRGEMKRRGIIQIDLDEHQDSALADEFAEPENPEDLKAWGDLVKQQVVRYNNFNTVFAKIGLLNKQFWLFDGNAREGMGERWRAPGVVQDKKRLAGKVPVAAADFEDGYFNDPRRPIGSEAFVNVDVDVIDPMLGVGDAPTSDPVEPEIALKKLIRFLERFSKNDSNTAVSFHASTTAEEGDIYGDVETVRFLARVAPFVLLANHASDQSQRWINEAISLHAENVTTGNSGRGRSEIRSGREAFNDLLRTWSAGETSARIEEALNQLQNARSNEARETLLPLKESFEEFKRNLFENHRLRQAAKMRRYAEGTDLVVKALYGGALEKYPALKDVALLAYGSYGAGRPGAKSDVDLLVVSDGDFTAAQEEAILNGLYYLLLDVFKGVDETSPIKALRTLQDLEKALEQIDLGTYGTLLNFRYVAGKKELAQKIDRMLRERIQADRNAVIRKFILERNLAHEHSAVHPLGIDQKAGLGGIREWDYMERLIRLSGDKAPKNFEETKKAFFRLVRLRDRDVRIEALHEAEQIRYVKDTRDLFDSLARLMESLWKEARRPRDPEFLPIFLAASSWEPETEASLKAKLDAFQKLANVSPQSVSVYSNPKNTMAGIREKTVTSSGDRPGFLSDIAGTFAAHGISIHAANIKTLEGGNVYDRFWVTEMPDGAGNEENPQGDLWQVLRGEKTVPKLFEERGLPFRFRLIRASPSFSAFSIPTVAFFEDRDNRQILTILTQERELSESAAVPNKQIGLLYLLTRWIAAKGLNIVESPSIRTQGDVVLDTFVVTKAESRQPLSRKEEIKLAREFNEFFSRPEITEEDFSSLARSELRPITENKKRAAQKRLVVSLAALQKSSELQNELLSVLQANANNEDLEIAVFAPEYSNELLAEKAVLKIFNGRDIFTEFKPAQLYARGRLELRGGGSTDAAFNRLVETKFRELGFSKGEFSTRVVLVGERAKLSKLRRNAAKVEALPGAIDAAMLLTELDLSIPQFFAKFADSTGWVTPTQAVMDRLQHFTLESRQLAAAA